MVDQSDKPIKDKVLNEIDSIEVPNGLKEEIWNQLERSHRQQKRKFKIIPYLSMAACLMLFITLAVSQLHGHSTKSPTTNTAQGKTPVNGAMPSDQNKPQGSGSTDNDSHPLFQTSLTLPNGKIIKKTNQSVRWKDLSIQLLITSLPPATASTEGYKAVIGNHSTIISHKKVSTSAGKATFVLNKRMPPAASSSKKAAYEYWAIVYGNQYAYAVDATIVGDRNKAKNELMELLKQWQVPMNVNQISKRPKQKDSSVSKNVAVEVNKGAAAKLGKPGIFGYVMDKKDGRLLVVSPNNQDFSSTGGVSEFYDAVWVSSMPESVKIGQKVKVWFHGGVLTSYPGQAGAGKFEVIKISKPDQADLSESEALRRALAKSKSQKGVLTVLSIKYNKESDNWHIKLKNTFNGEEHHIQVEDKKSSKGRVQ